MDPSPADDARLHLRIDPTIDRNLRIACVMHDLTLSAAVEDAIQLWLIHINDMDKR